MTKKLTLINGPYNGRKIDDGGEVVIRMSLHHRAGIRGTPVGESVYMPDATREKAFWDGNHWIGTLEEIIPA